MQDQAPSVPPAGLDAEHPHDPAARGPHIRFAAASRPARLHKPKPPLSTPRYRATVNSAAASSPRRELPQPGTARLCLSHAGTAAAADPDARQDLLVYVRAQV